jgi:NAD(P)-dependent dehydrogenase (short-subunit alcohol dehydrogenase family)
MSPARCAPAMQEEISSSMAANVRRAVAATAAFLAGPESSFITGAEYFVDGGQIQV